MYGEINTLPLIGLPGNRRDEANHPDRLEERELQQSWRTAIKECEEEQRDMSGGRQRQGYNYHLAPGQAFMKFSRYNN